MRFLSLLMLTACFVSCREPLVVTQDEEKQQMLLGQWKLSSVTPPSTSDIYLNFKQNLTVDITVISDSTVNYVYFFRVEDGDLYFRSDSQAGAAEFVYNIDFLSTTFLRLSFASGQGDLIIQDYERQ